MKKFPEYYAVLDVETPNLHNNSICQIGLIIYRNGVVIDNYSTLINPESNFSKKNILIHGIKPEDVENCETLYNYWSDIKNVFTEYVIVSHNSRFDLNVLAKSLKRYSLELCNVKYFCTFEYFRENYPELDSYHLSDLCDYIGAELLKAHDASSDCIGCASLFEFIKEETHDLKINNYNSKRVIDLNDLDSQTTEQKSFYPINIEIKKFESCDLNEKRIILTGIFTSIDKDDLIEILKSHGALIIGSVSPRTDFLIIGNESESSWKYKNCGTKIIKAMEIQKNGGKIKCIDEDSVVDFLRKEKIYE